MIESAIRKVGDNIRRAREGRGFTQERFAQHLQLDRAYYGRIERGQQNISLRMVFTLATELGVAPETFFSGVSIEDCARFFDDGV